MDRDKFLALIHQKLADAQLPQAAADLPAPLELAAAPAAADLVNHFAHELTAVNGHVHLVMTAEEALAQIEAIFEMYQATGFLSWDEEQLPLAGLHEFLNSRGYKRAVTHLPTDLPARAGVQRDMAAYEIGITGALAAIAESGSLVLQMGPGRGRFASLLPGVHIALITAGQITPSLQHFIREQPLVNFDSANVVAITGPSRTGDIEGVLTLGVHGPKELHVIVQS